LVAAQPDFSLTAPGATVSVLVQDDWLLLQPDSLTAPGATAAPVAGQVLVQAAAQLAFSPTAPMLVPDLSAQVEEHLLLHSPTAPGEACCVFVELQPTSATTAHTATRLRIDFIGTLPPK
jgi:hypothetical protein